MLSAERKLKIAEIVSKNGGIKTSDLSSMFNVSEMTVLRDLAVLEEQGILKRVYGGALVVKDKSHEISSIVREKIHSYEKNIIAEKAIGLVEEGDCIFLDGSTTTLSVAKKLLYKKDITVITNSLDIMIEIRKNPHIKLVGLGGELQSITMNFLGPSTEMSLRNLYSDKAFISPAGISLKSGITVENPMQGLIKKIMIENSAQGILLADSSKFGRVTLNKVCSFDEIKTIITDKKPPNDFINIFNRNNIKLIY
jgi:DeoR/GlpR family transcriptional regulator of sugar metabolism